MKTRPLNRENKRGILLTPVVCIVVCGTAVAGDRDTSLQRAIDLYDAGSYAQSIKIKKGQTQEVVGELLKAGGGQNTTLV